jgi:hypothetical protein
VVETFTAGQCDDDQGASFLSDALACNHLALLVHSPAEVAVTAQVSLFILGE